VVEDRGWCGFGIDNTDEEEEEEDAEKETLIFIERSSCKDLRWASLALM